MYIILLQVVFVCFCRLLKLAGRSLKYAGKRKPSSNGSDLSMNGNQESSNQLYIPSELSLEHTMLPVLASLQPVSLHPGRRPRSSLDVSELVDTLVQCVDNHSLSQVHTVHTRAIEHLCCELNVGLPAAWRALLAQTDAHILAGILARWFRELSVCLCHSATLHHARLPGIY